MATVLYNIDYGTLAPSWYGRAYKTEKPSINTLKDLTAWIHKATIKIANDNEKHIVKDAELLTLDDWMPLVEKALKAIGATYRSEGEWFVKDDAMSVPKDSILFIGVDVDPKTISDEAREEFAQDPDPRSHVNGWPTPQMVQEKQALEIMALAKRYGLENHYRLKFISMKKFDAYKKKFWTRKSKQ